MQAPSVVGWTTKERLLMFWQHKKPLVICFISVIFIGLGILGLFAFAQVKTLYAKFTGIQPQANIQVVNVYNVIDPNGNPVVQSNSTTSNNTNSTFTSSTGNSTTMTQKANATSQSSVSSNTAKTNTMSSVKQSSTDKKSHFHHKIRLKESHFHHKIRLKESNFDHRMKLKESNFDHKMKLKESDMKLQDIRQIHFDKNKQQKQWQGTTVVSLRKHQA